MAVVQAFAERNGLKFDDLELLRTALTHRSYLNEHPDVEWDDNERLEYLGDAVLDFLLADMLFRRFPEAREGELTSLRAALGRRETLARFAERLGLGAALLMGHGEVETGGRTRAPTLCAAFEALIGALYLDRGLAAVADFVMPLMEQELETARAEVADKDPKSRLQELAQGLLGVTPRYRTVRAEGPDHAKVFTVEVYLGDAVYGIGEGHGKQVAAQRAAANALARQAEWAPGAIHE
ncbi:MAG: ribonuclease III [Anaerolineae bacterium]|nr:ribonuclease III [Anaerolineae bacterium]